MKPLASDRCSVALGRGSDADRHPACHGKSSISNPQSCISQPFFPRSAFTLVELLVVVVIISMLVGLLMPALQSARGRARIATCTNNQHELSLAITQYDVAKKHLPGYLNRVRSTPVTWVPVLFPFMGRNDLWEGSMANGSDGWRRGSATLTPYIAELVCPDNADNSVPCPLSYVVDAGVYNFSPTSLTNYPADIIESDTDATPSTPRGWGIFRNYYNMPMASPQPTPQILSLSSVKSPARTAMLSESALTGRQWTTWNASSPWQSLTFSWPNYPSLLSPVVQPTGEQLDVLKNATVGTSTTSGGTEYLAPLPPIHPGIVIVTFCDGHTESLSDDTECKVYQAVP